MEINMETLKKMFVKRKPKKKKYSELYSFYKQWDCSVQQCNCYKNVIDIVNVSRNEYKKK